MTDAPLTLGLTETQLRALAAHGVARTFRQNSVVINEGDETDSLYIILSGKVKVYLADESGKEIVLNTEGPGSYFGEMVLDGGPRSASVMTLEKSTFSVVGKSEFRKFLSENPEVAIHIIENLIARTRALTENVRSLALLDVYGRVAKLLLELAREVDGKLVIADKLTQQDIANRVGASREMISRILKDLATGGYIKIADKKIVINKKPPARW
ncbi:MAG: Crp/Fnr family transcriptional regulator [Burkholderiales bacterium]|nr:Crp/Fnr family transcriptional regulator [Burkholderiales bacterium]